MEDEYNSLDELMEDLENFKFYINKRSGYVLVMAHEWDDEHPSDLSILYKFNEDDSLTKIDIEKMREELIPILSEKVSIDKLMDDVLATLPPDELKEVYERAVVKKGKIREEEGCYKLMIGGKRGSPFELMLR